MAFGVAGEHRLIDGTSALTFVNLWSQVARGLDPKTLNILLDRSLLRARDPPRPAFDHIEFGPSPTLKDQETGESKHDNGRTDQANAMIITKSFKVSANLISALKEKSKQNNDTINFSTFEILAGHLWKCVCSARALPDCQETKLSMATDGRARLRPPMPPYFFGNVIFVASAVAKAGDLVSKPSWYAASIVHDGLERMDSNYLRSALDFLELQPNLLGLSRAIYGSPNLGITSWVRLPLYGADFGWGRPIYVGPAGVPYEGKLYIVPASGDDNDKALLVTIALKSEDMKKFEMLLYYSVPQIDFVNKLRPKSSL